MKKLTLLFVLCCITATAQDKYLTKTGTVSFEASVPSVEEVSAKNEAVTAILNTESGEFASLALVKGFRFKNALMEEHFNENYAESHDYPKATFKGTLKGFDANKTKAEYLLSGELTFHGKTETLEDCTVHYSKTDDTINLSGSFTTSPETFGIKIPSIVKNKIAKTVDVDFHFVLMKK